MGTYAPPALSTPSSATMRFSDLLHHDAYWHLGPHAQRNQAVRQLVRALLQLRKGERRPLQIARTFLVCPWQHTRGVQSLHFAGVLVPANTSMRAATCMSSTVVEDKSARATSYRAAGASGVAAAQCSSMPWMVCLGCISGDGASCTELNPTSSRSRSSGPRISRRSMAWSALAAMLSSNACAVKKGCPRSYKLRALGLWYRCAHGHRTNSTPGLAL